MLNKYEDHKCVSITVIKGKADLGAGYNAKEQIPIGEIGIHVTYPLDVEGVLKSQQSVVEDYVLTQQSNILVIPIDSDNDHGQRIIDLKTKRQIY